MSKSRRQQRQEDNLLLTVSIERVINTSVRLLNSTKVSKSLADDLQTNLEDWDECKQMVRSLWDQARNEAFLRQNPGAQAKRPAKEIAPGLFRFNQCDRCRDGLLPCASGQVPANCPYLVER